MDSATTFWLCWGAFVVLVVAAVVVYCYWDRED